MFCFFNNVKVPVHQKTPDENKNFFQNYLDHLDALFMQWEQKSKHGFQLWSEPEADNFIKFLVQETLGYCTMLDKLRDGYDYYDEIMGVTALPILATLGSVVALTAAIYKGASALVHIGGVDGDDSAADAVTALIMSALLLAAALGSLLKSALSLVSRPVVTAFQGYGTQNVDRFCNDDAIEGVVAKM
ncbi:MAG: hypothetical protein ACHP65_06145 [Legionellales bacterium]